MTAFAPLEKSLWLHKLCEANFGRLLRLVPDLERIEHGAVARVPGKPALHLKLLEHGPYTRVFELTHDFPEAFGVLAEPAVRLRVCFDARTVEMLSDVARPRVHEALREESRPAEVLDYKWSLNYFLSRWLDHCLAAQYRFARKPASSPEQLLPV